MGPKIAELQQQDQQQMRVHPQPADRRCGQELMTREDVYFVHQFIVVLSACCLSSLTVHCNVDLPKATQSLQ